MSFLRRMLLRDGRERRLLPSPHGRMAFQHHRWKITWVLGLGLLAGPAVCGAQSGKLPVPTTGVYLGIWADPDLPMMVQPPVTKNQESAVEIREGPAPWGINHPFALHLVYYNWTDIQTEVVNGTFPDSSLQGDIEHGRIPVISWHCDQSTTSGNTDALIASGDATETATITATAQALAKYPGPVLLRWFWEFNLLQSSEAGLNQYCLGDVGLHWNHPAATSLRRFHCRVAAHLAIVSAGRRHQRVVSMESRFLQFRHRPQLSRPLLSRQCLRRLDWRGESAASLRHRNRCGGTEEVAQGRDTT